jgi:hypothetical protein
VGITVGLLIAVGFAGLWVFLALRRHKKQRIMELEGPPEDINISPVGRSGSRSPLDDGDNDSVTVNRHMSARYINLLAQLNAAGLAGVGGGSSGELLKGDGNDQQGGGDVAGSVLSHPSSQGHPYMPGFGQAADTLREEVGPMVIMADNAAVAAAYVSRSRRESSSGPDPAILLGDKDPSVLSSAHGHSSLAHGNHGTTSANERSSYGYDDDPYATYPLAGSSSQIIGASASEIGHGSSSGHKGSLNGHRRSIDKWQSGTSKEPVVTPPTSYTLKNGANSETNSLKSILDRLRGGGCGSEPSPEVPDVVVQDLTTPPPSATGSTFPSLYTTVVTRPPTPPSSLLRPMPPHILNMPSTRPSLSAPYDGDRLWPNVGQLTLPPLPSPAISERSEGDIAEGLLDPQLPWRLERARFDSSGSLRDHEDYSRPIGGTLIYHREHSTMTSDTNDLTEYQNE